MPRSPATRPTADLGTRCFGPALVDISRFTNNNWTVETSVNSLPAKCSSGLLMGLISIGLTGPVAQANDRSLTALSIPPSSCQAWPSSPGTFQGSVWHAIAGQTAVLYCPLPVTNIEMGASGADNDMSKFRVHFRDSDGPAAGASVSAALVQTSRSSLSPTTICSADLGTTTTSSFVTNTIPCRHDISSNGAFYVIVVTLRSSPAAFSSFLGIDFPP